VPDSHFEGEALVLEAVNPKILDDLLSFIKTTTYPLEVAADPEASRKNPDCKEVIRNGSQNAN
jgi:hypothetical protein